MGDAQEIQLQIKEEEPPEAGSTSHKKYAASNTASFPAPPCRSIRWWLMVLVDMLLVLAGQTVATLLTRFYYNDGGNSKWMACLTVTAGSPLLAIPLLLSSRPSPPAITAPRRPLAKMTAIYAALGLITGFDNLMYSYGLLYLPVSTFSLVSATQLAFNAVYSYFLNAQCFTALITNSVVLLTFSAALLGVSASSDDTSSNVPHGKYPLGFVMTLSASATFSLILSLIELTFEKVTKARTIATVLELQLCTSVVASVVAVAGLFASREWKTLHGEMEVFKKGKAAYVMTLAGTAVSWQVSVVGVLRLIARVSSLFANVTSTLGLPLVPVFAVVLFGDRMTGVKVVAMLMAVWGFLSYVYQHHLDAGMAKRKAKQCRICVAQSNGTTVADAS